MDPPYHQRPEEDESDEEQNPFETSFDPNASSDRVPLTQDMSSRRPVPQQYSPPPLATGTPPYGDRPASRYTLSETYARPGTAASATTVGLGPYGPGAVSFPFPTGGRPMSVISNLSEDWIQRQQPVAPSQADLRRYQTRRVRLNQGNVFSADYPYTFISPIFLT